MSLEQIREQNKRTVIEQALICFAENSIENTKISDIAKKSGLAERTVYRYFSNKADIVLSTAYLFWDRTVLRIENALSTNAMAHLSGIEQVEAILLLYADIFKYEPKMLIFGQEAELYLYKNGIEKDVINRPPVEYESFSAPFSKAIRLGIKDGTLRRDIDIESAYYNIYSSMLGLMQKMALDSMGSETKKIDRQKQLESYCKMIGDYLANR
ncbi:MAG: helix-turn-helix domain-containing protein [Oscillospiraceae bacterium]